MYLSQKVVQNKPDIRCLFLLHRPAKAYIKVIIVKYNSKIVTEFINEWD